MVNVNDVLKARERISNYVSPTLLEPAASWPNVWLKLENTNLTHSFKIRGALNAILSLDDMARRRGIVTASSGNHAQGVAYAAYLTGAKATIFMPSHTPKRKIDGVKRYRANIILDSPNYDESELAARQYEQQEGMAFVSPYNDPQVIAGAGTIGLEIMDSLPEVKRVVVPVSGGGLISGIGLAIKSQKPGIEVVGVNALSAPSMHNLFYGTDYLEIWDTFAEALSGDVEKGSITIQMTKQYVDRIVMVTEKQIAEAMRWMVDEQGWMVEGGAVVGVAALLNNLIDGNSMSTAIVISGGNVDGVTLRKILGQPVQ